MRLMIAMGLSLLAAMSIAAEPMAGTGPYRLLKTEKVGGDGGFDYVTADSQGRKLYVPRANRVEVFDLDTLKPAGTIADTKGVHGTAIDAATHHAFSSSNPVVMWDTGTLAPIKTIPVEGRPDGIFFDAGTSHVFVFSHVAPNATVIDSKDGSVVGTIDLGGAPEQAVSDGKGHLYVDIEDKNEIAVVDTATLKKTGTYALEGKGGGPAGLAIDAKNHLLFATCRDPQNVVILNAVNGKILATLPIGAGSDGALFNPATMEAFSSNRDGTLTIIREKSGTEFEVEQNVQTHAGAKTATLDAKTNQIYLITADRAPATQPAAGGGGGGRGRGAMVPGSFSILVVGK